MPLENPNSAFMMKTLIENYFTIEENGCEIPGLSSTLLMKNGYVIVIILINFNFFRRLKIFSIKQIS